MILRSAIRAARLNAKLSQAELAKKMGVSRVSVTNWENGKGIREKHLRRLAEVTGFKLRDPELVVG